LSGRSFDGFGVHFAVHVSPMAFCCHGKIQTEVNL